MTDRILTGRGWTSQVRRDWTQAAAGFCEGDRADGTSGRQRAILERWRPAPSSGGSAGRDPRTRMRWCDDDVEPPMEQPPPRERSSSLRGVVQRGWRRG
jgi:hypothetical protein